jgi:hypothetical protein
MQIQQNLSILLGALALPQLVAADFDLWSATCSTGFGDASPPWQRGTAGTFKQGACNGVTGTTRVDIGKEFTTPNPCNSRDTLTALPNGRQWNLYLNGRTNQVGFCFPGGGAQGTRNAACNGWNYACAATTVAWCRTTLCN